MLYHLHPQHFCLLRCAVIEAQTCHQEAGNVSLSSVSSFSCRSSSSCIFFLLQMSVKKVGLSLGCVLEYIS